MKKILALILAVGTMLAFTACGEKENVSSIAGGDSSELSSVVQTESEEQGSEAANTESTSSKNDQTASQTASAKPTCTHKYSAATCTEASKCTLCGELKGAALGHSYSAGKCTRCGAVDSSFATYKEGGKDSIIRTTADGKSTTLKIDISKANTRFTNISSFGKNASMTINYTKFCEVDGWLFFAQTVNLKYTVNNAPYDVTIDEFFKIKTDGTGQSAITTVVATEDKGIAVAEVFGFSGNTVYYVVENEDEGFSEIYKAPVSLNLTNLVVQGSKVAGSPTPYASIANCSLKDGYLYFTEKQSTYDATISAAVTKVLGNYKMKLDGTGLTKI